MPITPSREEPLPVRKDSRAARARRLSLRPQILIVALAAFAWLCGSPGFVSQVQAGGGGLGSPKTTYVYDELGRLVQVVDSITGNSATYHYDAVGNLLSITTITGSSTISISEISPDEGPVGAQVTISGTGFSATASSDSVQFNGTTATVTSASTLSIVATVPAGATSGAVTVTSPNGSATSAEPFTVTAALNGPTISGFSPSMGSPGTAVTITGTNFQPSLNDNDVAFNDEDAEVTSASSTTLAATAPPSVGSGPITVTTSFGTAISSSDFFVLPSGINASNVGYTGDTSTGANPTTVTLGTANKVAILDFTETAGHTASVLLTGSTFSCCPVVTIISPNGSTLYLDQLTYNPLFTGQLSLTETGTYSIIVNPGSLTGSVNVQVFDDANITGTIAADGSPVNETINTPGQEVILSFNNASQGENVSLNVSYSGLGCPTVNVYNPDGTPFEGQQSCGSPVFFKPAQLPQNGTYTIVLDAGASTGNVTFNLYNVVNVTGTIVNGGPPVPKTVNAPGQEIILTFNGSPGQNTRLNVTYTGFSCFSSANPISVYNPDNTLLESKQSCASPVSFNVVQLPQNGTYTIVLDPLDSTGSATFQLFNESDLSSTVNVTDAYAQAVLGDWVQNYWRLDETSLATAANAVPAVREGVSGPTSRDTAITLNGASYLSTASPVSPGSSGSFTLETWFKSTSTTGGTLIGFTNTQTTNPIYWDRGLYMNIPGNLVFGVWNGSGITGVTSPSVYNDGNWHYVAASFTDGGQLNLYVDGALVASSSGTTADNPTWAGYWHIGWTMYATNWPWYPSSYNFQGSLGETAIWNSAVLTATQVSNHYGAAASGNYDTTVLADSPSYYWKLNESSGSTFGDATGNGNSGTARSFAVNGQYLGNVTLGVSGANSDDTAVTLDGSTAYVASIIAVGPPKTYSLECWFKTTTNSGGTLIGFNDSPGNSASKWDRALYMTNSGQLVFGLWNGGGNSHVISPSAYNDGNWHYVAGTFTGAGQLLLYVDGSSSPVALSASGINDNSGWTGYWHIGWTRYAGDWLSPPTSYYFSGTIDEPAVYAYALSGTQTASHYHASGR